MKTLELLRTKRQEINEISARHGAHNIRIFGSVARGEDTPESDVDLLVDVGDKTTPWFPGGLISDLEELLLKRVDILTNRSLHPRLRDKILAEALPL